MKGRGVKGGGVGWVDGGSTDGENGARVIFVSVHACTYYLVKLMARNGFCINSVGDADMARPT